MNRSVRHFLGITGNHREFKRVRLYRHFKGKWYLSLGLVRDSENQAVPDVLYKALYGKRYKYYRNMRMFLEPVPKGKPNPTGQPYRFMTLGELIVYNFRKIIRR